MVRFIIVGDYFAKSLELFKSTNVALLLPHDLTAGSPPDYLAAELRKVAAAHPEAIVIFMAGNCDVQIDVFRRAIFHGETNFNRTVLRSVYTWTKWIRELELTNKTIVCGVFQPTVQACIYARSLIQFLGVRDNAAARAQVRAFLEKNPDINALEWRRDIATNWNEFLKVACGQSITPGSPMSNDRPAVASSHALCYIDVNEGLLDEKGDMMREFIHPNPINHSLLWEPQIEIWKARLDLEDSDLVKPRDDDYLAAKVKQKQARWVALMG
jgi:hypothetical protein